MYMVVHTCVWVPSEFKKPDASYTLEMELQVDVSHPTCILGTKPKSSGRAESTLKHWATSQAPLYTLFCKFCEYINYFKLKISQYNNLILLCIVLKFKVNSNNMAD